MSDTVTSPLEQKTDHGFLGKSYTRLVNAKASLTYNTQTDCSVYILMRYIPSADFSKGTSVMSFRSVTSPVFSSVTTLASFNIFHRASIKRLYFTLRSVQSTNETPNTASLFSGAFTVISILLLSCKRPKRTEAPAFKVYAEAFPLTSPILAFSSHTTACVYLALIAAGTSRLNVPSAFCTSLWATKAPAQSALAALSFPSRVAHHPQR